MPVTYTAGNCHPPGWQWSVQRQIDGSCRSWKSRQQQKQQKQPIAGVTVWSSRLRPARDLKRRRGPCSARPQ